VTPPQTDNPPSVGLTVSPTGGAAPLTVNVDASASTDTDQTPIASYTFAFGDGTTVGPQAGPTASHVYPNPGKYTVTVTVADTGGLTSTATAAITVTSTDAPPKAALTLTPASGPAPLLVRADASGSTDTDGTPIATYSFDFGDGSSVGPQAGAIASHQYASPGTYQVVVTVTDTAGLASTAQQSVTVTTDAPPVASLSLTPTTGRAPLPVSADASASTDNDATPISSYRFDFGDGTVVGPQAAATATHTYASAGTYTVRLTVTDTAGLASSVTQQVTATTPAGTQFVGNSGFETNTTGWNTNGRANVTLTRVSDAHSGSFAAALTNTDGTATPDCTLNDSPNWVTKTESGTYTAALWVKAPTAGAKLTLRIREYNGSTNVGQLTTSVTLSTSWQQVKLPYVPTTLGSSLDFTAYTSNTPSGTCFLADDATETLS
jgi:PKD repeat protein